MCSEVNKTKKIKTEIPPYQRSPTFFEPRIGLMSDNRSLSLYKISHYFHGPAFITYSHAHPPDKHIAQKQEVLLCCQYL